MNPHALEAGVPYLAWAKWKSMHFMGVFIQQTGNLLDNTWPPIFFSLECRKMFYLSHETCLATGKLQKMDTMSLWKLPFLYRIKKGVYLVVWYLWDNAKFQSFRVTVLFFVCRRETKQPEFISPKLDLKLGVGPFCFRKRVYWLSGKVDGAQMH